MSLGWNADWIDNETKVSMCNLLHWPGLYSFFTMFFICRLSCVCTNNCKFEYSHNLSSEVLVFPGLVVLDSN